MTEVKVNLNKDTFNRSIQVLHGGRVSVTVHTRKLQESLHKDTFSHRARSQSLHGDIFSHSTHQ